MHIHHDLRKMFITLVWNDKQSFHLHHFHIIVLPVLFYVCQISTHCFIIELQYNKPYNIKLYIIVHIKSSYPNFEDIVNVNRL